MKIHLIAAARPNFMKIAPLYHALKIETWADPMIVHTGQHYDLNMSDVFFQDLKLPEPDIHLGVGSGSHAEQTGQVMIAYEKVLLEFRPDMIIVVGDVNSTVACTLAAVKIQNYRGRNSDDRGQRSEVRSQKTEDRGQMPEVRGKIPDAESQVKGGRLTGRPLVGHLEAGLRSFDRTMPEEINRLVTDTLADILWTPSPDGDENLIREGVAPSKIKRVGNIMIDSLEMLRDTIEKQNVCKALNLDPGQYGLVTLHRPSNVDDAQILKRLCKALTGIAQQVPLVFPIHPRTRKNIEKLDLMASLKQEKQLIISEPLNYINFMNLVFNCRFALTDSGGIQEETTYLGIPCLTLRPNTERPISVERGTNKLCNLDNLNENLQLVLSNPKPANPTIDLWDGRTAGRVVESIKNLWFPG